MSLSDLLYIENPYAYKKCQWRITARSRISTQAFVALGDVGAAAGETADGFALLPCSHRGGFAPPSPEALAGAAAALAIGGKVIKC